MTFLIALLRGVLTPFVYSGGRSLQRRVGGGTFSERSDKQRKAQDQYYIFPDQAFHSVGKERSGSVVFPFFYADDFCLV